MEQEIQTLSSDNPEIESLGLEGIQSEIEKQEGQSQGGNPTPEIKKEVAPTPDPMSELQKQFKEFGGTLSEFKQQLGRVSAFQSRFDKLENQLKQQPPKNDNPEEAAQLAAQEKYIADFMAKKYGLTPEVSQYLAQDAQQRQAMNTVSSFNDEVKSLAGEDFGKLEKFAAQLVDEHWDKAIAGDPASIAVLKSPGNLLWYAQRLYASSADAQNTEIVNSRTKAVSKPTLRSGGSPTPSKGQFKEEDLDKLEPSDLPALSKQINEMEKANGW